MVVYRNGRIKPIRIHRARASGWSLDHDRFAEGDGPRQSLLALGYAGWGPGQLEDEIQQNGWLCVPADEALIFGPGLNDRWQQAMAKLGIDINMLSGDAGHA